MLVSLHYSGRQVYAQLRRRRHYVVHKKVFRFSNERKEETKAELEKAPIMDEASCSWSRTPRTLSAPWTSEGLTIRLGPGRCWDCSPTVVHSMKRGRVIENTHQYTLSTPNSTPHLFFDPVVRWTCLVSIVHEQHQNVRRIKRSTHS